MNVAEHVQDGHYQTVSCYCYYYVVTMVMQLSTHQQVYIHPSSCLFPCQPYPRLLLYTDLVYTSKCYMRCEIVAIVTIYMLTLNRNVSIIEPEWLLEVAPNYFKQTQLQDNN